MSAASFGGTMEDGMTGKVCRSRIGFVAIAWLAMCAGVCAADVEADRAAELYEQTFGADTPDMARMPEAIELWQKLAGQGDSKAMYYLSAAYFQGIPDLVEADDKMALSLLEKSAEEGLPEAQFSLGWQYEGGAKVERDPERAFRFYESAARQGYSLAVSRLIRVFSNGELGKSPDARQAKYLQQKRQAPAR
jgi:TPR repeat protein